jgi:sialate O-acetylesterase
VPKPKPPAEPVGKIPGGLFNGMIAPLMPYAIKGTIWYQGESNNLKPFQYRTLFPLLISDWRERWGEGDFPFLFVQIAPFKDDVPELKEAQFLTWKKTPNTAMVVTVDVGDANALHPRRKEPVGDRLALAARALAYGEKIEYSGPAYESMKIDGNKAILTFSHVGSGLLAKDGPLKGFTIAGADKNFVEAKAEINGDTVVVSSDQVSTPVAVRYAWANVPDCNLWNKDGLPASPFRTDPESLTEDTPPIKKVAPAVENSESSQEPAAP